MFTAHFRDWELADPAGNRLTWTHERRAGHAETALGALETRRAATSRRGPDF
jgi:hypothetical protein